MFEELFANLANFGYLGIFLISLIGTATIIFPLPAAVFVFGAAAVLNPLILGIVAGLGAAIGELTGYFMGYAGEKIGEKKIKERVERIKKLFKKYGGFLILVVFAATPLPDDIVGIVGGFLKYEIGKFFVAVLIGKIIFHLILAYGGYYGINWILDYFSF